MAANYRLVIAIAKRFLGRGLPLDVLIQEGIIGLQKAVEKFDLSENVRLATYAIWWIRAYILRATKQESDRRKRFPFSLDRVHEDENGQGEDAYSVLAADGPDLHAEFERKEKLTGVAEVLISHLKLIERTVIHCRFYRELTLEQTAMAIAHLTDGQILSRERVRQIQNRTMDKLKRILSETGLDD